MMTAVRGEMAKDKSSSSGGTLSMLLLFSSIISLAIGFAEECTTDGDIRLADGVVTNEGRVEVCVNGEWGTICDHNWGAAEAHVVCNQLGLPAEYADALYRYGGGSGPIHFAGFHCTGSESHLINCTATQQASIAEITNCQHFEDAGVICSNVPCVENNVRLNEEVVQICHNQEWGTLCGDTAEGWGDTAAHVICSHVGIPSMIARAALRQLIFYDAPVVLNSVACSDREDNISECTLSEYGNYSFCTYVAVAQCEVQEPCSDGDTVRLTQFSSETVGRLEVCSGGVWGTVCGNGTTIDTVATVVCKELDHAAEGFAVVEGELSFVLSLVPIALTNMMCTGFENAISECSSDGVGGNPDCDHFDDILIACAIRQCNETDVRLVRGQTPDDGRVEICLNGLWGSVCDDMWDIRDAEVVCKQLHYIGPSYPLLSHDGFDTPPPIHLDNVHCDGTENMLTECSHRGIGVHDCVAQTSEAGVICTNVTCEHGTVHLVGGSDVTRGRVEYCYEGIWYSVCASGWEENGLEAKIICETLGYSFEPILTDFGRGTSPILPLNIQCDSSDTALTNCTTTGLDVSQCPQVAGLNCAALCLTVGLTDCDKCESRADCGVTSNGVPLCQCYSDCYEYGDCCSDVSHVQNCVVEECETGDVRLVGGTTNSTGRLEVCGNGIWGRVCNRFKYWGPNHARVVCRQLGFSEDGAYIVDDASIFGTSDRNPLVGEIHCIGTESGLFECSHSSIGAHNCGHNLEPVPDIAIYCDLELSCSTNDEIGVVIDCQGYEPDTFLQCSFDSGPLYPCSIPIVLTINVHPSGTYSLHIVTSTAREDTVTYTITDKEVDVSPVVPQLRVNLIKGSPRLIAGNTTVEAEFEVSRPVAGVRCYLRSRYSRAYKDCSSGVVSFDDLKPGKYALKVHAYNRGGDMATAKNGFVIA